MNKFFEPIEKELINKAWKLFYDAKINQLEKLLNSEFAEFQKNEYVVINEKLLYSRINTRNGNFELAKKQANSALESSNKLNYDFGQLNGLVSLSFLEFLFGNKKLTIKQLNKASKLLKKANLKDNEKKEIQAYFFRTKGIINNTNLKSIDYLNNALELELQLNHYNEAAITTSNIASNYMTFGMTKKALEFSEISLSYLEKGENDESIKMMTLMNLADIHRLLGELNEAEKIISESLVLARKYNNFVAISNNLGTLGLIYQSKGKYEGAVNYLTDAIELGDSISHLRSEVFFRLPLIQILLEENQVEKAKLHLEQLNRKLPRINEEYLIKTIEIAQALILGKGDRLSQKGRAQDILNGIIKLENLDPSTLSIAYISLLQQILDEIRSTGSKNAIIDLENVTEMYLQFGRKYENPQAIAEAFLIHSKVALLNGNLDQARILLTQAQVIAEGKGFDKLASAISLEHDKLLENLKEWKRIIEDEVKKPEVNQLIDDWIELSAVEALVKNIVHHRLFNDANVKETPSFLIVINQYGLAVYSKHFGKTVELEEQLFAGLLTAIASFSNEVFGAGGSFDRIIYGDYVIQIRLFNEMKIVYAYKGVSFSATKKLNALIEEFNSSYDLTKELMAKTLFVVTSEIEHKLNSIVNDIFVNEA